MHTKSCRKVRRTLRPDLLSKRIDWIMEDTTKRPPAEQSNSKHKPLLERISLPIAILCGLVTVVLGIFGYYHNLQKEIWEQRLNQAKEETSAAKEALGVAKQEIEKLKAELKARVERELPATELGAKLNVPAGKSFQVTLLKSGTDSKFETASFGADLKLTLMDLKFHSDPPRYTVTAKVNYDDLADMQLREAEEGAEITYPKEHGYRIKVVKVDAVSAKFSIVKNP